MEHLPLGEQEPITGSRSSFQRPYPPEMRKRALRMVHEAIAREWRARGRRHRCGASAWIGPQSLRSWGKQDEIDNGERPGVTTEQQGRFSLT
jgi:transposase